MTYEVVKVYRWCERCFRWRSVGNFSHAVNKGKTYNGRHCHRCIPSDTDRRAVVRRTQWTVTAEGRAFLAAERAAA